MKLLTHNMLACTIKGVQNGFPLKIEAEEVVEREADFDPDFLRHIFPKLEWAAFLEGARALGCAEGLPDAVPEGALEEEAFLRAFHHALLEVHLEEGALVCPETGRRFIVSKGIPNMLLNEDEV
ncbi:multifunctional methyltransferase subunit [Raphidocelis subcapitata]|uniref:Multifunctional methyltransferase subunit n=1 Tax=Raphidocelis subcapitata TaxID=307507 RepID=A0A2V0PLC9_9CHLO|nr:multifunctional methyltransferase subunit [Raphidocelis subcapitata]|eukprot:GBG00582.1 multifunctional methyltransferase subunit [Raphidocelis subcapitata]